MSSAFFGLEIGRRALLANQQALEVVGHNTSNVNTPGYSRQIIMMQATEPHTVPTRYFMSKGQVGTGVEVGAIIRMRDEFVDRRVFTALSSQGALTNLSEVLKRVEQSFGEPGNAGIGQMISEFFNAFSELSANPESGAIRSTVRNRAEAMINAFRSVNSALDQINPEISLKVATKVADINALAKEVAALNRQIRMIVGAGNQPNDLMDKRGQLLEQISAMVDIQVISARNSETGAQTGELHVNVGGYPLVQGDLAGKLPITLSTERGIIGLKLDTGETIALQGGEVYGLIRATAQVNNYKDDLNRLARTLVQTVNAQHRIGLGLDGQTARDFFAEDLNNPALLTAGGMSLSVAVRDNLDSIAAAKAPIPPNPFAPGNGDNARALAAFGFTKLSQLNDLSLNEYYADRIALIGSDSRAFQTGAENQDRVLNQLKNLQASVSGVSLDEEMTRMMQFQRAYQAAARIITVMDDALDRIVNGLGVSN
jgi:flagellar hook-associated protein 1 FlgK